MLWPVSGLNIRQEVNRGLANTNLKEEEFAAATLDGTIFQAAGAVPPSPRLRVRCVRVVRSMAGSFSLCLRAMEKR